MISEPHARSKYDENQKLRVKLFKALVDSAKLCIDANSIISAVAKLGQSWGNSDGFFGSLRSILLLELLKKQFNGQTVDVIYAWYNFVLLMMIVRVIQF